MKKLFLIAFATLALGGIAHAQSQDCLTRVQPLLEQMGTTADAYPADKINHFCIFSEQAFFLTNKVPDASLVYDITDLRRWGSENRPSADLVIDLRTLSFWEYNFQEFQRVDRTIYFKLSKGNSHKYLAVRSYNETSILTEQIEYPTEK